MSQDELREHASYLGDEVKLDRYERALRHFVGPDTTVLDLGAGSGILGLLAARAGARRVYAVDSGPIIGPCREVARRNGFGETIVHLRAWSEDVVLPEPVDVAVCDQIGGFVYEPGLLTAFADARRRLMVPGGALVPGRFRLLLAPVERTVFDRHVSCWEDSPGGFDFRPFAELARHTDFRVDLDGDELLGAPSCVAEIDAASLDALSAETALVIERRGEIGGLAGMFDAELAPGVRLDNVPGSPDRMRRWQNFYPLRTPAAVDEGDVIRVKVDLRPLTGTLAWRVEVHGRGAGAMAEYAVARCTGATVQGAFLSRTDLELNADDYVPMVDERVEAARVVLDYIDGRRTKIDIAEMVLDRKFAFIRDTEAARAFVQAVLGKHARPRTEATAPQLQAVTAR